MKLGLGTKLDKRNIGTSKKFDVDIISTNCDIIAFFQFMVNLQPSGSRIPNAGSLAIAFYLTKTENRTKKLLTLHS